MNSHEIVQFLRLIGAEHIVIDEARGWVRSSCPLAPWMHEGGRDRKPSFGIKIPEKEGEAPYYNCFTCASTGPLPRLLTNLMYMSGSRMAEASNFLSQHQLFDQRDGDESQARRRIRFQDRFAGLQLAGRDVRKNEPVPDNILAQYPLLSEKSELTDHRTALLWIARDRKISLQSIAKFQLRLYVSPLDDVGVIFPILSKDGEQTLDLWARLIGDKQFFRITPSAAGTSVDFKAPNLMFGNHLYDPDRPVVLVEGALDALRLYSIGCTNVLAALGGLSNEQLEAFYARSVLLGFDSDEAGRTFTKKAVKKLQVPSISILDWSVAGIKDAGELTDVEQFRKVFDARIKILRSDKIKERKISGNQLKKRSFIKSDGTFL